jgi:DNA-3-methyladenine glycosylase I
MNDEGIVRNRLKIQSAKTNAIAFLAVQKEFGSFDAYLWRFKDAEAMSKDLLKRGFRFVGPTICYAFMQAIGIVNDHAKDCFRRR